MPDFGGAATQPQAGPGFGATSSPSASQVQQQALAKDPQESVISRTTLSPPAHVAGARYLIDGTGAGGWTGRDDSIAESDGQDWQYTAPSEGMIVEVEDTNVFWWYNGSAWATLASGLSLTGPVTTVNNAASPYTVLSTDVIILCDTSGGAVQIDLPASAALSRGLAVIRDGTGLVTIDGNAAETVGATQGGGATYTLDVDGEAVTVRDINVAGNEWIVESFGTQKLDTGAVVTFDEARLTSALRINGALNGGLPTLVNNGASPYTVLATDHIIVCDTSGGPVQLDLPTTLGLGRMLRIIRDGGSAVTLDGAGAETVQGAATYVLGVDGDDVCIFDTNVAANEWSVTPDVVEMAAATAHASADGSSHTFIDQDVTNGAAPVFAVTNMTGSAAGLDSDATTHAASDGSDHTFIDQDVTSGASPTLDAANVTGIPIGAFDANAVALADMAQMAVDGIIGNNSGNTANPQHLTVAEAEALLGIDALQVETAALGAENTDGHVWIGAAQFTGVSGTWTPTTGSNNWGILRRTADAGLTVALADVTLALRTAASKGRKLTSYRVVYSVNTATVDDVLCALDSKPIPADNVAPAAMTAVAGSVDGDYDADHNTAAERGDATGGPEYHTATVTIAAPAYGAVDTVYQLGFQIDGDAGAAGVVDLYGVVLSFSETLVDLS